MWFRGVLVATVLSAGVFGLDAARAQSAGDPPAAAQTTTIGNALPDGLSTALQLTEDQRGQIRTFVASLREPLLSGDTEALRRARIVLLDPLEKTGVSVAFRLELAGNVLPIAEQMAQSQDPALVINALRIAGDLATEPAGRFAAARLEDQRTAVRFEAAAALNRLLESVWRDAPAVKSPQLQALVRSLAQRVDAETDAMVTDALVRALISGFRGNAPEFADVRASSLRALSEAFGKRVRDPGSLSEDTLRTAVRAATAIRDVLTDSSARGLTSTQIADAAAFGGDVLALTRRAIKSEPFAAVGASDGGELRDAKLRARDRLVQLASLGEAIVYFAQQASGQSGQQTRYAQLLRDASVQSDAQYAEDLRSLIGAQGVLARPPFNISADRYRN